MAALETDCTLEETRMIARCLTTYHSNPTQSLTGYIRQCASEGMAPVGISYLDAWDRCAMTHDDWDRVYASRTTPL